MCSGLGHPARDASILLSRVRIIHALTREIHPSAEVYQVCELDPRVPGRVFVERWRRVR